MPEHEETAPPRYKPELIKAIREGRIIDEAEFGLIPPERQREAITRTARITFLS